MVFRLLSRVPLFGDVLRIFNAYAFRGDAKAGDQFASVWLWITAFWLQTSFSCIATLLCMPSVANMIIPENHQLYYLVPVLPGALATSILPNLLGFGIGIYALIFGLHKMLLRDLQNSYKSLPGVNPPTGSALVLNAEMAVPLLVLALTIVIGIIQQIAPELKSFQLVSWFSLWFSLIFTIELIHTLFGLGENVILKTLDDINKL